MYAGAVHGRTLARWTDAQQPQSYGVASGSYLAAVSWHSWCKLQPLPQNFHHSHCVGAHVASALLRPQYQQRGGLVAAAVPVEMPPSCFPPVRRRKHLLVAEPSCGLVPVGQCGSAFCCSLLVWMRRLSPAWSCCCPACAVRSSPPVATSPVGQGVLSTSADCFSDEVTKPSGSSWSAGRVRLPPT